MKPGKRRDGPPPRVIIEGMKPEIDAGRHPIKRVVGEAVVVECDLVSDGHDLVAGRLLVKHEDDSGWTEAALEPLVNDRWRATFVPGRLGRYRYTVIAWVDHFGTWVRGVGKKVEAQQDVSVELKIGADLIDDAVPHAATPEDRERLIAAARELRRETAPGLRLATAFDPSLRDTAARAVDRDRAARYPRELVCVVDPIEALYSTWYELFPRSYAREPGAHGTFRDLEAQLPRIAGMGFDVLYLPPIHPIGTTHRKGKNNALTAEPGDPGSPWAIGSEQGGHKAVHPELGTLADFRRFVQRAREQGIRVALDVALQCSPDHPYVKEHPEWFRARPDGTIQYAENPPKKYQDIYPFDFESEDWRSMWEELQSIFFFWIEQGVSMFRVDNPHTKALPFWEWCIAGIKAKHPEAVFLSEAFTRPKLMYALAKLGFTQGYTYFTWRNHVWEHREYLSELFQSERVEYFRPNFWPNTPDILPEHLQHGGRPAHVGRLIMAATMTASYGMYGPAFELMDSKAKLAGGEEYLDSEKYEIKRWDLDRPGHLREVITRVNRIRRENPALQQNRGFALHGVDNDRLLAFSKRSLDGESTILVVINVDPYSTQGGFTQLDLAALGLRDGEPFEVHDLLIDGRWTWYGPRNFVQLDPQSVPAHVFRVRRFV